MVKDEVHHTKYEKARMIGSRALQISQGAPLLIKLSKEELEKIKYDPIEIAIKEFDEGVIPITVRRTLPENADK
ncbi:MAG: DNA-directed RNA polymerase subunit K [Nanoarchaeota archaeon]|nr:DNA-directed RNA polymerase subunit K [Nanoarchaeota archaeon]